MPFFPLLREGGRGELAKLNSWEGNNESSFLEDERIAPRTAIALSRIWSFPKRSVSYLMRIHINNLSLS
jgi:hypothetical protein